MLAPATVRRLACDAAMVPIIESASGEPLAIGRKTRVISRALNRSLKRRDRGCRFPGCCNTRFVDAHHIEHWADGGETCLDNLVLLCRHHHRLLHEGGYSIERADAAIVFRDPMGNVIPACAETRSRGDVFALFAAHERVGIVIDSDTITPDWYGERPDHAHILSLLGPINSRSSETVTIPTAYPASRSIDGVGPVNFC